jgi:hypothetical protein
MKGNDAPLNSLKDSNVSLKAKTSEEEGVEVCFLIRHTSRVKGAYWSFGMGIRMSDK